MIYALLAYLFWGNDISNHLQDTKFKPRYNENAQFNNCRLVDDKYKCTEK
jgi:hypothetical protein